MGDDATETGVSTEKTGLEVNTDLQQEQAPELSERDKIFAQAEESRRNELIEDDQVELEPEAALPEAEAGAEGDESELKPETIEVKVEGETNQVSLEEINERLGTEGEIDDQKIANFQKHLTADKRLEDAAGQKKLNEEEAQANEQKAADLATKEAELAILRETPAGEAPAELDPEMVGKLQDAFLLEDTEASTKILSEIVTAARGPAQTQKLSTQDIDAAVGRALTAKSYDEDLKAGREAVKKDFAHITGNPALQAAMDVEAKAIWGKDKDKKPSAILMEAAEAVNKSILAVAGTPESEKDELTEKKRGAATHSVKSDASMRKEEPVAPAAPSNKSVVAQMVENRNAALAGHPKA